MTAKDSVGLARRIHVLGKRIAQARFELKWAGKGRSGAPAKPMTAARRKEVEARVKALEKERAELRAQLPKKVEEVDA
jgi:hypothetical protein